MTKEQSRRRFGREFKLAAVRSMKAGTNVTKFARDLGISRKGLYEWRNQFSKGGVTALRGAGRPMLEPTSNLDRESADHVVDLIRTINQRMGSCFLISTHDEYIASRCQRRIKLVDGRIVRSWLLMRSADKTPRIVRSARNRYHHFVPAQKPQSPWRVVLGQYRRTGCLQLLRDNEALQRGGVGSDGLFARKSAEANHGHALWREHAKLNFRIIGLRQGI
ncbi:MAG: transposase [Sphingorhabdus sp.]